MRVMADRCEERAYIADGKRNHIEKIEEVGTQYHA